MLRSLIPISMSSGDSRTPTSRAVRAMLMAVKRAISTHRAHDFPCVPHYTSSFVSCTFLTTF